MLETLKKTATASENKQTHTGSLGLPYQIRIGIAKHKRGGEVKKVHAVSARKKINEFTTSHGGGGAQ